MSVDQQVSATRQFWHGTRLSGPKRAGGGPGGQRADGSGVSGRFCCPSRSPRRSCAGRGRCSWPGAAVSADAGRVLLSPTRSSVAWCSDRPASAWGWAAL